MDACLLTVLIIIVIFVVGFILLIKFGRKPKFLCCIPNRDVANYRKEAVSRLATRGYILKEKENGNVFVQKDVFSATTLVFKQNGLNVDVLFIHSNSNAMLAAFIICFFTIWILAIVLALVADSNSKSFRDNDLTSLLMGYATGRICPNCGRPIPMDALICPYCAKQLN